MNKEEITPSNLRKLRETVDPSWLTLSQPSNSHQETQEQEQDHVSHSLSPMAKRQRIVTPPYPVEMQPQRSLMIQKESTVPPPFPWATSKRSTVHTLNQLNSKLMNLKSISGTLVCKHCKIEQNIQFDLVERFNKVKMFIEENRQEMLDGLAPDAWMSPELPTCENCRKKPMKPLITKKRNINWLFLLLGQLIGCCKLVHLKYFCKHADEIQRTSGDIHKHRLVYLTYIGLCKQLEPDGPFNLNP